MQATLIITVMPTLDQTTFVTTEKKTKGTNKENRRNTSYADKKEGRFGERGADYSSFT